MIPSSFVEITSNSLLSMFDPLLTLIFQVPGIAFFGILNPSTLNVPSLFDGISKLFISTPFGSTNSATNRTFGLVEPINFLKSSTALCFMQKKIHLII